MATDTRELGSVSELREGARMSQKEFHALYEQMPANVRAELIEGVVYIPSPVKAAHGDNHSHVGGVLFNYEGYTPGVRMSDKRSLL